MKIVEIDQVVSEELFKNIILYMYTAQDNPT